MTDIFPKLRPVDIRPFVHNGAEMLLLRDPLALAENSVIVPRVAAPILALCDGTRDLAGLQAALQLHFRMRVHEDALAELIAALDETCLLDNGRAAQARAAALARYHRAPYRPPTLAGGAYPAEPADLAALLQEYRAMGRNAYAATLSDNGNKAHNGHTLCGLVSPHIDYDRGGPVYGAVWDRAAEAVRAADLAVIFGTDHSGGEGRLTLTRQHYATPFGVLPTARETVDACAGAIGEEAAFAEELHHRSEHSIELAAVWLHHIRDGRPCEVLPVLCGSFGHFVRGEADPAADLRIAALVETLKDAVAGRQVLVIAAADLAHVGPAFDGAGVGPAESAQLRVADDALLSHMAHGDAQGFFDALKGVGDRHNVCGLPPIYLALRLLGRVEGQTVAYDHCPADDDGASLVTIAGMVWS